MGLAVHQSGDDVIGGDGSPENVRTFIPEVDPTVVEAVEHAYSREGVLHPLTAEQRLPARTGHGYGSHRHLQRTGEGGREIVRRHPARAFELHDALPAPTL